jgi:hypothetical protein
MRHNHFSLGRKLARKQDHWHDHVADACGLDAQGRATSLLRRGPRQGPTEGADGLQQEAWTGPAGRGPTTGSCGL